MATAGQGRLRLSTVTPFSAPGHRTIVRPQPNSHRIQALSAYVSSDHDDNQWESLHQLFARNMVSQGQKRGGGSSPSCFGQYGKQSAAKLILRRQVQRLQ